MYDPERDHDRAGLRYYQRWLVVAVVTALAAFAAWPALQPFPSNPGRTRQCIAVVDGWHGTGTCGTDGRHRLIVSGALLALWLVALTAGVVAAGRRRAG